MENSEKALKSDSLTDYERLLCGSRRVAIFMKMNQESTAIEEYKKYIAGSSIIPRCSFAKDKIIIRNVLKCNLYQDMAKEWILSKYCEKEEDIHKFDQTWIINTSKKQNTLSENEEIFSRVTEIPNELLKAARTRTPAEIQSCCNTCSRLATASAAICGCLMFPESLGGPILVTTCTACCLAFVETIRQDCERCCYNDLGTCAKSFETWKTGYKNKYSECPQPPKCCN